MNTNRIESQNFKQFTELKRKMQDNALNNDNLNLFSELSELTTFFLNYGNEKYNEGLDKGVEIVKTSYNL